MPIPIASKLLAKMIIAIKIIINSSSSVFEVFAPLVSIAPLALLVLLYYIHMWREDRQASGHQYPIQDTGDHSPGDCDPPYSIPQKP